MSRDLYKKSSKSLLKPDAIDRADSFVVLLATSELQISEELNSTFKNTKIEVLNVNSTKDLILAMTERQIDLLIFDPNLNRLRGLEVLPVVKKLRPQVRVIVISEDMSFETREALVKEGVTYQLPKQMKPGQISQVITTVVRKLSSN